MVNHHSILAAVLAGAAILRTLDAQAHAFLDHAAPAVGSTVSSPPVAVTMWFTQELAAAFTTATVTDAAGKPVEAGPAHVDPKDPAELELSLKPLSPGNYTVSWRALSVDTHTTTGHFTFTVGGG